MSSSSSSLSGESLATRERESCYMEARALAANFLSATRTESQWDEEIDLNPISTEDIIDVNLKLVALKMRQFYSKLHDLSLSCTSTGAEQDRVVREAHNMYHASVSLVDQHYRRQEATIAAEQLSRFEEIRKEHRRQKSSRCKQAKEAVLVATRIRLFDNASERQKRLKQLKRHMEMLDQHRALISIADSDCIWNPKTLRFHGEIQGKIRTPSIEPQHLRKIAPGAYEASLRWTAAEGATVWPSTILIPRRADGRYETVAARWVSLEDDQVGKSNGEFKIKVTIYDKKIEEDSAGYE